MPVLTGYSCALKIRPDMGLIRQGLEYIQRLRGFWGGGADAGLDLVVRQADAPALASPNFGAIEQMFMAGSFSLLNLRPGVTKPYAQHVWVYACVNAIAQNIAGVPLNFYAGTKKNKRLVESAPIVKLFETPNPMMSGYQLIEATMIFLGITGEAFYILDRPNITAVPKEIWTFHPNRFEHVPAANGGTRGWIYRKGGQRIPLEPHEVVFFRYPNPYDDYRGLSPVSVASLGIEQDYHAAQYNANFFKNGAQLGGFLESEENLSQEEFDRVLAQFNDRHQGVSKAHQIGLLEGGLKYKEAGLSQRDMDFLEGRKYNREEICGGVYKVPIGELGLNEDVGSEAREKVRRKQFWETTLDPKMTLIELILWSQLCRGLTGPEVWPEFDRKSIPALQEDRELLLGQAEKLWAMGYPANVVNEYLDLGLPKVEGGDTGYIPFNLQPVGDAAALPATEPQKATVISIQDVPPKSLPAPAIAKRDPKSYWLNFNKLRTAMEEKFHSKIKRYFYEQRKVQLQLLADRLGGDDKTVSAVKKEFVDDLLFDLQEANEKLQKMSWNFWLNAGQEAGQAIYTELGFDLSEFVIQDSAAIDVLKDKLIKVVEINDITRDKLRETLSEGLSQVESVSLLQDRVREVFNSYEHPAHGSFSRSLTIARTETGQAMATARDAAMDQLKVEKIEWGTAGDGNVRNSHIAQSGMVIKRGETFPNGCRYPCDPAGAAGEVINCRCVGIPVLGD